MSETHEPPADGAATNEPERRRPSLLGIARLLAAGAVAVTGAALVIHPDGEVVDVNLAPSSDRLALMREHLDCRLVDVVALTDRLDMWLDDEGVYGKPVNSIATSLARRYGYVWQPYHGSVLLCSVDGEGASTDLDTAQLRAVLAHLADV